MQKLRWLSSCISSSYQSSYPWVLLLSGKDAIDLSSSCGFSMLYVLFLNGVWLSRASSSASDLGNCRLTDWRFWLAPLCEIGVMFLDTDCRWDGSGADIVIGPSNFLGWYWSCCVTDLSFILLAIWDSKTDWFRSTNFEIGCTPIFSGWTDIRIGWKSIIRLLNQ